MSVWLACLLVLAAPAAAPPEKVAVLLLGVGEGDFDLAENLTEIVIAEIAQSGRLELAGTSEFRSRLEMDNRRAQACIDDRACLGRAAVSLGVRRIVTGTVQAQDGRHLFQLTLRDIQNDVVLNHLFRLVEGDLAALVADVRRATRELFQAPQLPGKLLVRSELPRARVFIDEAFVGVTPLLSPTLVPGVHAVRVEREGHFPWSSEVEVPPGANLELSVSAAKLPRRKRWPTYAAFGTATGATLSLVAAGALGFVARTDPDAPMRADAQRQFENRHDLGMAANISLVSAVVLGAASTYLFVKYWPHIAGADAASPGD